MGRIGQVSLNYALTLLGFLGTIFTMMGCPEATKPKGDAGRYGGVDIDVVGKTYEAIIGTNVYLQGAVKNSLGEPQRGVRVYFSVTPTWIGRITPWAWTEPDSPNGFATQVVFDPESLGVALIKGEVRDESLISWDTVSVWVRNPINR
ncbi:MAG: hypothetical protein ACK4OO_06305 [bacterium]